MFAISNIEYKGYAAATTGGVSYIVNLEVDESRFPEIEKNMAKLNIIVSSKKVIYCLVSRLIDDDGSVSHWREDATFTKEEKLLIQTWIKENDLLQDGRDIVQKYEYHQHRHMKLLEESICISENYSPQSMEDIREHLKLREELDLKIDIENKAMENLKNIQIS